MNPKIEKEFKRLKNLKQHKGKSDNELQKLYLNAQINIAKKQVKVDDRFLDEKEQFVALELFEHYVSTYEFEKFTDLCTLQSLIYEEILLKRIQNHINTIYKKNPDTYLDKRERETLTDTEKRIEELKIKLGIDKEDVEKDELSAHELLEKRFEKHINANKEEFTLTCIAEDSLILMSDLTTKKIQDIKIGDEIIGLEKNNYSWKIKKQKVLNFFDNGIREVLKLKVGNNELELTPEHRILAEAGFDKSQNRDIRYYEAFKCWNRNVKVFNYITDLEKYYEGILIGIIQSDGFFNKNINKKHLNWKFTGNYSIAQKTESKAVDWILDYFGFKYSKKWKVGGYANGNPHVGAYDYRISSKHTNFIKCIEQNIEGNKDNKLGFLCGFLIGDGNRDGNNSWNITQSYKVNQHKIDLIERILKSLRISYTINKRCNNILNIRIGSCRLPIIFPNSKKAISWYKKFLESKPYYSLDKFQCKFIDIEEKKKVYDLTTETHNFVANGLVVHNCGSCGKMLLLRRRVKNFDNIQHPWFAGRWFFNYQIILDVKEGKISKTQAWRYLCSASKGDTEKPAFSKEYCLDYIDYCLENWDEIIENLK